MARDFSKNTSNYMTIGVGALGPILNGAGAISAHAIVTGDTLDATSVDDNRILSIAIDGASSALRLHTKGDVNKRLNVAGRSVITDALQSVEGTTTMSTGTEYSCGGVLDIAGDKIRVYLNGSQEANTAVTFNNATYTHGTPTDSDRIGADMTTPPFATHFQWDGSIAEVAVWAGDIGTDGFYQLNKRISALLVRPDLLIFYAPLWGKASPEPDIVSGKVGTITGTVAQRDPHPRIYWPRRRRPSAKPITPSSGRGVRPVTRLIAPVPGWHPIYAG